MASGRPMIGEIELELVQKIETDEDQVLVQHSVPALEGDFLQRLGRRASRIKLSGVMTGPESAESLKTLRAKFRDGEPASFVADIATATQVGDVLIEEFGVRELAGKAERFAYELTLREMIPPPAPQTEPPPPVPPDPVPPDVAELEVEVIVEGQPDFDFSKITVTVAGTAENSGDAADGAATITAGTTVNRTLTNRTGNVWLDDQMPPGQFTATASTDDPVMTGSAGVTLGRGERKRVTITLHPGAVIAKAFIVHFWFDKSFVEPCMCEVLQQVARYADAHPSEKLAIIGHADKQGGFPQGVGRNDYNQSLSERRARSVYSYLTFKRDSAAALTDWNTLRLAQNGEKPTLKDNWGIREYQYILQSLGHYSGNINERHLPGDATDDAVRAFQGEKGLTVDGIVGDVTWAALIEDYLKQSNLEIPESQFFPNAREACNGGILKWLGASEHDPVKNTEDAWRPNRRVEMLFIAANQITCKVPKPVTFHLPPPAGAGSTWCLDNGSTNDNDFSRPPCFTTRIEKEATAEKWLIQPAEPGDVIVSGRITFEDGTPLANTKYVLIAPDGKFMDDEVRNGADRGRPKKGRTGADGSFSYKTPSPVGIYTMEVELPPGPHAAFAEDEPPASARGSVVCKRLDENNQVFNVKVHRGPASDLTVSPQIILASPVVVVKKSYTNPARQLVTLRTDGPFVGTGTFERSSDAVRFFDAAVAGNEITFNDTDNVFTGAQLTAGVQLFAEGATASASLDDVQLTLALTSTGLLIGPPATATMTSVELTLDIAISRVTPGVDPVPLSTNDKINPGRAVQVQDPSFSHERAMLIIHPPNPTAFVGTLTLIPMDARVQVFEVEIPANGQSPLNNPHTIATADVPPGGLQLFAEGVNFSAAPRDTGFKLGIQGLENEGDRIAMTAVQVTVAALDVVNAPALSFVRFGLWDNGYDATGEIKNDTAEANNFIGLDKRKFHFRVRDAAAAGSLSVNWKTLKNDRVTDDDAPASQLLTLPETAAGSEVFVSRAVMLVTDETDLNFATNSGLVAPFDTGDRNPGQSNHRTRRAAIDGFLRIEYVPQAGVKLVLTLPVFDRAVPFDTTSATNVAIGPQVVTPAAMSGRATTGARWAIKAGSQLTIDTGANLEEVLVTAVTPTTFTADFTRAHDGTAAPFKIAGHADERRRVTLRVVRYNNPADPTYLSATDQNISDQFEHANRRWNQAGLQVDRLATDDRQIPAGALSGNGRFPFAHPDGAQEQAVLADLLPITPDNTLTVVFVHVDPADGFNAYAAILPTSPVPLPVGGTATMDDRYFIFVNSRLNADFETLAHELHHVLFNRFDGDPTVRFFTFNTNAPSAPLPDVRKYRRIQTLHFGDVDNDPNNDNTFNWHRRERTARFPVSGDVNPAATNTTGNLFTTDF